MAQDINDTILDMLAENSRVSLASIASETNMSAPSVRRRIAQMVSEGTIKRFTVERGDAGTSAIVLVTAESGSDTAALSERINGMDGVRTVYEITGQHDIVAIVHAPDISEMNRIIDMMRETPGIQDTNTAIILRKLH